MTARPRPPRHEIVEHTADLGIQASGPTLEAAFVETARGLFTVLAGDLDQIRAADEESFHVSGVDPAWLLFDWCRELLAGFDLRRMIFRDFTVSIDASGLRATARGERYDPARHRLAHEIKAVTQHLLAVRRVPDGWETSLIVDV